MFRRNGGLEGGGGGGGSLGLVFRINLLLLLAVATVFSPCSLLTTVLALGAASYDSRPYKTSSSLRNELI